MELYGQNMLVDGVGTSLIAMAPYAQKEPNANNQTKAYLKNKVESVKQSIPANARAGSLKQPGNLSHQPTMVTNAYNEAGHPAPGALQQNFNVQNKLNK